MNTVNRRILVSSAAASMAVMSIGLRNVSAQPAKTGTTFESALTGSVIEILDAAWAFNDSTYSMEEGNDITSEYVTIDNDDLGTTAEIEFVQSKFSAAQHLERIQGFYEGSWESFTLIDSDETESGAWMAGIATLSDVEFGVYCEYQAGAYEGTDLIVLVNSRPDQIAAAVTSFQAGVVIGDLEPMLMLTESDAEGDLFVASATSGGNRTTRGTTEVGEDPDPNEQDLDTQDANAYILAIDDQRLTFLEQFNTFAENMAVFADETVTDSEQDAAFAAMDDMAFLWVKYPTQQTDIPAPADLADLETLYLNWLEEIGLLGQTWMDMITGDAEVEALFDQLDVVDQIDKDLQAELETLR